MTEPDWTTRAGLTPLTETPCGPGAARAGLTLDRTDPHTRHRVPAPVRPTAFARRPVDRMVRTRPSKLSTVWRPLALAWIGAPRLIAACLSRAWALRPLLHPARLSGYVRYDGEHLVDDFRSSDEVVAIELPASLEVGRRLAAAAGAGPSTGHAPRYRQVTPGHSRPPTPA